MSRAKAQTGTPPVSLFPFLAVLLCTMGALIVILVAIAHQARRHALQAARAQQARVQARLEQRARELQARLEDLLDRVQHLEAELRQDAQRLEQLVRRKKELEHEVRRWQTQLASAGKELEAEELDRLRQRLVWYRHKLQEVEAQLKKKPPPQRAVSYAIVPFQGHHGTRRRPIYIECRQNSVLLQPGAVELRAKDFLHAGPQNPLLAALRATVQHWRRQGLPPEETPYPLILVRPEGIAAYYAVRRALQSWKGPLGYELIEEDWKLEFGSEDPRLVQLQRLAVQKARRLQRHLARGSSGPKAADDPGLYQADVFGGLRPVGSAGTSAPGSGRGIGSGSGGFGGQAFRPTRSTTSPANGGGTTSGQEALAAAAGSGAPIPGPTLPGGSGDGASSPGSSTGQTLPGSTPSRAGSAPGLQSSQTQSSGIRGGDSRPGRGRGSPSLSSSSGGAASLSQGTTTPSPGRETALAGGKATTGAAAVTPSGVAGGRAVSRGTGGLGTSSPDGTPPAAGAWGSPATAATGGAPGAASAGGSASDQQPSTLGFAALMGSSDPTRAGSLTNKLGRHDDSGPATLMEDPPPGAIPLRRAITANLYPDRLVILHNGTLQATTIPLNQPLGRWASQLTDVLAREIQSWGKAGRGMYWKPALRVHVAPGAKQKWQLLQQALRTSGLEVQPVR